MPSMPPRRGGYSWITGSDEKKNNNREFARVVDPRYNSRKWRAFSITYRKKHPICMADGCEMLSAVTDHVIPVTQGGNFWAGPFQALCHRCHNAKSAREKHT